jgi:anti-anti-sigma regulatory factor
MEFKIDTKPDYVVVTPVSNELNASLTEALRQKWWDLNKSGSRNLIVDLHNCLTADSSCLAPLQELHSALYDSNHSAVFTNLTDTVAELMKEHGMDAVINIAPTTVEAIDIVRMEILERDLFNEES